MKSITLVHTVKSMVVSLSQMLRRKIRADLAVHGLWDDYLANGPNEKRELIAGNRNRPLLDIKAQELTGADLIVTTCSTLTPIVETIRPFIKASVIVIDGAMVKASAAYDERMPVTATAGSTAHPTVSRIEREGETAGEKFSIDIYVCAQAFRALKVVGMEKHDRILIEKAKGFTRYDCIVLAQASMAHLGYKIIAITGCPVFTGPRLCVKEVKQKLAPFC